MKYSAKPSVVEAIQFTGSNYEACMAFLTEHGHTDKPKASMMIGTGHRAPLSAQPGDYLVFFIIDGVTGQCSMMPAAEFESRFEASP